MIFITFKQFKPVISNIEWSSLLGVYAISILNSVVEYVYMIYVIASLVYVIYVVVGNVTKFDCVFTINVWISFNSIEAARLR